ncbi:RNA polymerase sigma factor [Pedobacter sp. SYP-B3415]|uniref:RNA polymerase sigma factor n=1 Tax=Pedobacter sp. SYP-B3415 TaxID=2496641 RepID=UPI001F0FF774|nr:RNA polymerase sigma factor [Pedobacter sp. SYP-B3415]
MDQVVQGYGAMGKAFGFCFGNLRNLAVGLALDADEQKENQRSNHRTVIKRIKDLRTLIASSGKNDSGSKEFIYKSFYGYLKAIVIRYTSNEDDIQELVNDSFVKIFTHIQRFQAPETEEECTKAFKSWMAKITSRTAIDHLRSTKKLSLMQELTEADDQAEEVNVLSALHVRDILNLLNQLPELHRLVFNMYEIEGFSHEEIATSLSIPESSSRVYLTRAKSKLRKLYAQNLTGSYEAYK